MSSQTPRLETLIERAMTTRLAQLWTSLPGRVVSFDQDTCLADVQPMVRRRFIAEDGDDRDEDLPQVRGCPVQFQGGQDGQLTFPVKKGDLGVLVFTSASLDNFLATGAPVGPISPPFDRRQHTLNDAIFLHGLTTMIASPSDYSDDATVLRAEQLRLGGIGADEALVQGTSFANAFNLVLSKLNDLCDALIAAHSALGPYPDASPTGIFTMAGALKAALAAFDPSDYLSGKVTIE